MDQIIGIMKIVKLKVINHFHDTKEGVKRLKNDVFECSEKRAKEILSFDKYQLVEILSITNGKK